MPWHKEGREILRTALREMTGREPSLGALQTAAAWTLGEGGYGRAAYKNKQTGEENSSTNNWGAVQGKIVDDSRGMIGGWVASDYSKERGWYTYPYQLYSSPEAGARHMLEIVFRTGGPAAKDALMDGDLDRLACATYAGKGSLEKPISGYYEGVHGKGNLRNPIDKADSLERHAKAVAKFFGEPLAARRGSGIPPLGSTGPGGDADYGPFFYR